MLKMKTLWLLVLLLSDSSASSVSPVKSQRRRRGAHATCSLSRRAGVLRADGAGDCLLFETRSDALDLRDGDTSDLSNKNILALIEGSLARFRGGSSSGSSSTSSALLVGLKNSLASGLAAACSKTILAPFDTLKTAQQYMKSAGKSPSLLEVTRIIIQRPKGVMELYVRVTNPLVFCILDFRKPQLTSFHLVLGRLGRRCGR
jgi:hypothetical protein